MKSKYNNEVISVIIPIYKVEAYLSKCIDSVLTQTYHHIEIILVDDGSPDKCPQICDEYASKDSRIKVIHKKNGGLSDARNAGLDIITGRYVMFIDSDDFIENDMVEHLFTNIVKYNGDISVCRHRTVYASKSASHKNGRTQIDILDSNNAIIDALYGKRVAFFTWGKLYKTKMFDNNRFPLGKFYEDVDTTYRLINISKVVVSSESIKYNYLIREDSITGSKFSSRNLDALEFASKIMQDVRQNRPSAVRAAESYLFNTAVNIIYSMFACKQYDNYQKEFELCKQLVIRYCRTVAADKNVSIRVRFYAYAAKLHVYALYFVLLSHQVSVKFRLFIDALKEKFWFFLTPRLEGIDG